MKKPKLKTLANLKPIKLSDLKTRKVSFNQNQEIQKDIEEREQLRLQRKYANRTNSKWAWLWKKLDELKFGETLFVHHSENPDGEKKLGGWLAERYSRTCGRKISFITVKDKGLLFVRADEVKNLLHVNEDGILVEYI